MRKTLPVLISPNEEDNLILETDSSNKQLSAVLKIKKEEKFYRYCCKSFNKA